MKKKLCLLTLVICLSFGLASCGGSDQKTVTEEETEEKEDEASQYPGTWEITKVNVDGSDFTIDELEAMGDTSMSGMQLVIKDGGKCAIIEQGESTGIVDWSETETGIDMGVQKLTLDGEMLVLENNGNKMYFEKVSSEQSIPKKEAATDSADNAATETSSSEEVSADFKQTMDEYEAFFNEYLDFMDTYNSSTDPTALMDDYQSIMTQYTETMDALNSIDTSSLSTADLNYYTEVSTRISQKLVEAGQ